MGLSLKLFGGFSVRDGSGKEFPLRTRKIRALLAYLAVNADKPQPRERLMALLWSDRSHRQARQSLNQALVSIRRLADLEGAALLDSGGEHVTLRGDVLQTDVAQFRSAIANDPAKAAKLYDGPFLDGMSSPDPAFEEWLRTTRSEFQQLACTALERAAEAAEDAGNFAVAIEDARRLIALDPLSEDAHRRLMRLLHRSGDRGSALRQYQTCARILKEELDVDPDTATTALFEEIRGNKAPPEASHGQTLEPEVPPDKVHHSWPNKPSIAVLRFEDFGGDATAKLLADGLTEDVITALARVPDLIVISSDSIGFLSDYVANVQKIGDALGAKYILQGSLRTHSNRLRCSVRLVDTTRNQHIWAERYDRQVDDIFALQDEIVRRVLIELQVKLTEGDGARIASLGTQNLDAWLLRVQGTAELGHVTREGVARARALFVAAHKADPNWARPLSAMAACDFFEARNGWSASRQESIETGIDYAERAIEMDPKDPFGYVMLRLFNILLGDYDKALALIQKAVSVAPNDRVAVGNLGIQLLWMGRTDEAIAVFERHRRLSPARLKFFERYYGLALQLVGNVNDALVVLEALARHEPGYLEGLAQLAAAYASAGRIDAARGTVSKIRGQDPTYTASTYLTTAIYFQDPERAEWLRALLTEAGLA